MSFTDRLDRAYSRSVEAISSAHSRWLDPDPVDEIEDEDGPLDTELYRLSERHRAAVERRVKEGAR